MADVFISYVEEDADMAAALASALEASGFTTWYYERDCLVGFSYLIQTGQAIAAARAVVLLVSEASLGSSQVTKEVVRAHEESRPILPVLIDVTHAQFQVRQPEWREAIGAAASVSLLKRELPDLCRMVATAVGALLGSSAPVNSRAAEAVQSRPHQTPTSYAAPPPLAARPTQPGARPASISADALLERARARWPGCTPLETMVSRGGSPMLVVSTANGRRLVKYSNAVLLNRTAASLPPGLDLLLDEEYERDGRDVFTYREYVNGISLDRVLAINAVPVYGALLGHWALQVMRALAALHGCGIAHRDVSPANLVVDRDTGSLRLIDLKSAVAVGARARHASVGTPPYVAPEQLAGAPCMASDLYALGLVLVTLATRKTPPTAAARLAGDRPLEAATQDLFHPRDGTDPVGVWLARLVALDPQERYADAAAALEDTGDACTIFGEDLGELSLGDGVAIRMNSISWGVVRTGH